MALVKRAMKIPSATAPTTENVPATAAVLWKNLGWC